MSWQIKYLRTHIIYCDNAILKYSLCFTVALRQCSSSVSKSNLSWLVQNIKLGAPMTVDGGSSPMVKPKGDKQVEYLDLDLDSGKSTPPRKVGR